MEKKQHFGQYKAPGMIGRYGNMKSGIGEMSLSDTHAFVKKDHESEKLFENQQDTENVPFCHTASIKGTPRDLHIW